MTTSGEQLLGFLSFERFPHVVANSSPSSGRDGLDFGCCDLRSTWMWWRGVTSGAPVNAGLPAASLSASSLTFAAQTVGTSSTAQTITLSNLGNASLIVSGIALSGSGAGSFAETNTCGTSLAAGASCGISVVFTPSASGAVTATVAVTDNAAGSQQSVTLSGTGTVPAASFSATSLTFVANAGSSSAAQTVTLSNTGQAPLAVAGVTVIGTNGANFSETDTCGTRVAAGASCSIVVAFTATAPGSYVASLSVADNAAASPQSVGLSGTETAPVVSLSASTLNFVTPAESTSAVQTVTLTNTGNGALNLPGVAVGGTNASSFHESDNCGTSVTAGGSCTISLNLTAFLAMNYAGTVTIASNAPAGTKTVALTGTGTGNDYAEYQQRRRLGDRHRGGDAGLRSGAVSHLRNPSGRRLEQPGGCNELLQQRWKGAGSIYGDSGPRDGDAVYRIEAGGKCLSRFLGGRDVGTRRTS